MKNWKSVHRTHMYGLLKHIYTWPRINSLGFKWGTALYFFYQLPRFSVDLDFDLVKEDGWSVESFETYLMDYADMHEMKLSGNGTSSSTYIRILHYGWSKKLKIEISTSAYPNRYERKDLLGTRIYVMDRRWMFAHKLCAFVSRYQQRTILANRDLYDIDFFLSQHISPDAQIISIRSEKLAGKSMTVREWYQYLIAFIQTHEKQIAPHILDGLGELIDDLSTKQRLKETLLPGLLEKLGLEVFE